MYYSSQVFKIRLKSEASLAAGFLNAVFAAFLCENSRWTLKLVFQWDIYNLTGVITTAYIYNTLHKSWIKYRMRVITFLFSMRFYHYDIPMLQYATCSCTKKVS
jgi:hypothetical protein